MKLLSRIAGPDDVEQLPHDLDRLIEWNREWQMLFNVQKCKLMHGTKGRVNGDNWMDEAKL